jgi:hypothetical protein
MHFDPEEPLAGRIRVLEEAVIHPFGGENGEAERRVSRPAGVFDASGAYVPEAQCWRDIDQPVTTEPPFPEEPEPFTRLEGQWLYGGMLYVHFGHFLCESTSRLWGLDHVEGPLAGAVFLSKRRMTWPERFIKPLRPLLATVGAPKGSRSIQAPFRVERLVVAPQGFGVGQLMAGCPEYRASMPRRLGAGVVPAGAEKIYISRSRLFAKRGRFLAEAVLERHFEAAGFRIFHPQEHSPEEQIAQYKAARAIVSSDNSALHFAAFFMTPDARLAIIRRRPGRTIDDLMLQCRWFLGAEPMVIDALGTVYVVEGTCRRRTAEVFTEVDFRKVGSALAEAGLIGSAAGWRAATPAEVAADLDDLSARLGAAIRPMPG